MAIKVSQYQYDKICTQMAQEFGRIQKGKEEGYEIIFFIMEGNALKVHRAHPSSNGRRMSEAISLVLFQIKSYLTGEEYDLSAFQSEDNRRLVHALLMAFDPFTNSEIKAAAGKSFADVDAKEDLKEYFELPIRCLIRLKESVDTWEKKSGLNGYFIFLEDFIGSKVTSDEDFDYISPVLEEKGILDKLNNWKNKLFH